MHWKSSTLISSSAYCEAVLTNPISSKLFIFTYLILQNSKSRMGLILMDIEGGQRQPTPEFQILKLKNRQPNQGVQILALLAGRVQGLLASSLGLASPMTQSVFSRHGPNSDKWFLTLFEQKRKIQIHTRTTYFNLCVYL